MNLINRDEILEWINTAELTPDGGVDANVLIEKLKEMPVLTADVKLPTVRSTMRYGENVKVRTLKAVIMVSK